MIAVAPAGLGFLVPLGLLCRVAVHANTELESK